MATWYDEDYRYRRAISIDNTGSASATFSFSLTIPDDLADFWANVQSDGGDIILTEPDGFTPLDASNCTAVDIDDGAGGAFDGSTKSGRIRVDQYTRGVSNETCFLWLYWGNAAATTNSDFGSWTSPSTVTAYISREGSTRISPRIVTRPEDPGAVTPRTRISKTTGERLYVYLDFSGELNQRDEAYEGSLWYEGIKSAIVTAETGGGAAATLVDDNDTRLLGRQGSVIRVKIPAAGVSGTDYTHKVKVTTTIERVLERRFVTRVYDPVE